MSQHLVITTINHKSEAIKSFERLLSEYQILLVGDKKSQKIIDNEQSKFISLEQQDTLGFTITNKLPQNHYVRKNIGYLSVLKQGAKIIYDTDDDNIPYENWKFPKFVDKHDLIFSEKSIKFYNIYKAYSKEKIWPRGFPLNEIKNSNHEIKTYKKELEVGVWQGLSDRDPDVDAIYRLLNPQEIIFEKNGSFILPKGTYCPFNSQNTLWNREMIPYAYLPSTVTFRFTDILRGYIAQRCFWEYDKFLGFTEANVYQVRNEHDLMNDFKLEVPVYLNVEKLIKILDSLSLKKDYAYNLIKIYSELVKANIVDSTELDILNAWISDIKAIL